MLPYFIAAAVLLMLATATTAIAYVNGRPAQIELASIGGGHQLRADVAAAFIAMRQKAGNDGVALVVNSAFRSMEEQQELRARYLAGEGNLAAIPGYSNHQGGIAVDIDVDRSFVSPAYRWLAANASSFGFVNTGAKFSQPEPWHWEKLA